MKERERKRKYHICPVILIDADKPTFQLMDKSWQQAEDFNQRARVSEDRGVLCPGRPPCIAGCHPHGHFLGPSDPHGLAAWFRTFLGWEASPPIVWNVSSSDEGLTRWAKTIRAAQKGRVREFGELLLTRWWRGSSGKLGGRAEHTDHSWGRCPVAASSQPTGLSPEPARHTLWPLLVQLEVVTRGLGLQHCLGDRYAWKFLLKMESLTAFPFFLLRFYGQSEDGDEFNNSIRQLFLSFNTLMDRPLEEAVKIKVRVASWVTFAAVREDALGQNRTSFGGKQTK